MLDKNQVCSLDNIYAEDGNNVYNHLWNRHCIERMKTNIDFSTWNMLCPKVINVIVAK